VHAADFLTDGYRVISCSNDQTSILWDIAEGQKILTLKEHKVTSVLQSSIALGSIVQQYLQYYPSDRYIVPVCYDCFISFLV